MTTSEPTLNWADAPGHFREAHERQRAELEQARQAGPALEAAQREIAMLRAGIDTTHPGYEMFAEKYSGKNDPAAIQEAWGAIFGATPPPTAPATEGTPPEEPPPANADGSNPEVVEQLTNLQNERNNLGTGATAPGEEPTLDPQTDGLATFHARRAAGANREQAMGSGLAKIFTAAAEGDARVVSDSYEKAKQNWITKNGIEPG